MRWRLIEGVLLYIIGDFLFQGAIRIHVGNLSKLQL